MKDFYSFQCPNSHHTLGHLILHGFYRNITKLRPITANNIIFLNIFCCCCCHLPKIICINILYPPRACLNNQFHRNWRKVQRSTCSPQFHFIFQFGALAFIHFAFAVLCTAFAHGLWSVHGGTQITFTHHTSLFLDFFCLEILIYFILGLALASLANLRALLIESKSAFEIQHFSSFSFRFPLVDFSWFVGPPPSDVDDDDQRAVNQMKHLQFHQAFISLNTEPCIAVHVCCMYIPFAIHHTWKMLNHMDTDPPTMRNDENIKMNEKLNKRKNFDEFRLLVSTHSFPMSIEILNKQKHKNSHTYAHSHTIPSTGIKKSLIFCRELNYYYYYHLVCGVHVDAIAGW